MPILVERDWVDFAIAAGSIAGPIVAAIAVGVAAWISWNVATSDAAARDGVATMELLHRFRWAHEDFYATLEQRTAKLVHEVVSDEQLVQKLQAVVGNRKDVDKIKKYAAGDDVDATQWPPELKEYVRAFQHQYALATQERPSGIGGTEISHTLESLRARLPLFFELFRYAYLMVPALYFRDTSCDAICRQALRRALEDSQNPAISDFSERVDSIEKEVTVWALDSYWSSYDEDPEDLSYVGVGGILVFACEKIVEKYCRLSLADLHDRMVWERAKAHGFFVPSLSTTPMNQVHKDISEGSIKLAGSFKAWLPRDEFDRMLADLQAMVNRLNPRKRPESGADSSENQD